MNFRIWSCAVVILMLSSVLFAADGANVTQPGQLASNNTLTPLPTAVSGSTAMPVSPAATTIANAQDQHDTVMNRLWIASMVAGVAGTGFDAATSWGKLEGNGLLASSNGTFGAKGLSIKAGIAAAVIVPQILLRKHKELRTAFTIGNFAEAGIFSATAIHNLGIPAASAK